MVFVCHDNSMTQLTDERENLTRFRIVAANAYRNHVRQKK